jgi:hypothetical protein
MCAVQTVLLKLSGEEEGEEEVDRWFLRRSCRNRSAQVVRGIGRRSRLAASR